MSTLKNFARKASQKAYETREPAWRSVLINNAETTVPLAKDEAGALRSITHLLSRSLVALPANTMETFAIPDIRGEITHEQVGGFAVLCELVLEAKLNAVRGVIAALRAADSSVPKEDSDEAH